MCVQVDCGFQICVCVMDLRRNKSCDSLGGVWSRSAGSFCLVFGVKVVDYIGDAS